MGRDVHESNADTENSGTIFQVMEGIDGMETFFVLYRALYNIVYLAFESHIFTIYKSRKGIYMEG